MPLISDKKFIKKRGKKYMRGTRPKPSKNKAETEKEHKTERKQQT